LQRLTRDLSALVKDPVPGVFALPDPNNLLQVLVLQITPTLALTPISVALCHHWPPSLSL
jgi:hypothetical protein